MRGVAGEGLTDRDEPNLSLARISASSGASTRRQCSSCWTPTPWTKKRSTWSVRSRRRLFSTDPRSASAVRRWPFTSGIALVETITCVVSTRQRPTYDLLGPVRGGRIDEIDAEIERSVDDGDRLVLAGPVGEPEPAVPTAAETGDRDGQPGASECCQLH